MIPGAEMVLTGVVIVIISVWLSVFGLNPLTTIISLTIVAACILTVYRMWKGTLW